MGLHQRHPHPDTWEVLCDVCGLASSDATRAEIELVAFNEGFCEIRPGLWLCERIDAVHDAAAGRPGAGAEREE